MPPSGRSLSLPLLPSRGVSDLQIRIIQHAVSPDGFLPCCVWIAVHSLYLPHMVFNCSLVSRHFGSMSHYKEGTNAMFVTWYVLRAASSTDLIVAQLLSRKASRAFEVTDSSTLFSQMRDLRLESSLDPPVPDWPGLGFFLTSRCSVTIHTWSYGWPRSIGKQFWKFCSLGIQHQGLKMLALKWSECQLSRDFIHSSILLLSQFSLNEVFLCSWNIFFYENQFFLNLFFLMLIFKRESERDRAQVGEGR